MPANSSNPAKTYFSFIPGTPYQDRSSTEEILPYLLGPRPCPPRFSSSPLFDPSKGNSSWSWGKVLHGDRHALGILAAAGTHGTFLSLGWWATCTSNVGEQKPDLHTDGKEALRDLRKAKAGGCFPQREQICRSPWGHSADERCCRWQRSGSAWSTPAGILQEGLNKRTDTGSKFC